MIISTESLGVPGIAPLCISKVGIATHGGSMPMPIGKGIPWRVYSAFFISTKSIGVLGTAPWCISNREILIEHHSRNLSGRIYSLRWERAR